MISTSAARRTYDGPALFSFGFRPFFLFGAIWSAVVVPLWLYSYFHGGSATLDRDWHIHEMIFGFLAAVIAGFLTTAVPNWTGRMPLIGAPLGWLVSLWVLGRVAMLNQEALGLVAAVADCIFLVAFASVIWREVLVGRNWRNLPVCALVTVFALANIAFHFQDRLPIDIGVRLALVAAALLITLIGGRIVPSFTRNWMKSRAMEPGLAAFGIVDGWAIGLTAVGGALWVLAPQEPFVGVVLLVAGAAQLIRVAGWRGWLAAREPLVWILHVGYGWLGVALLLLGVSSLDPFLASRTAGIHALTAGAIGVMTLAVMTRATRGHTDRSLSADASTLTIYLTINVAALLRVAATFAGTAQPWLLVASGLAWSLAFGGFAIAYGRMLTLPRSRTA